MPEQRKFMLQSLLLVLILNGLILGTIWSFSPGDPPAVGTPLFNVLVIGAVATILLWLLLSWLGRRLIAQAAESVRASLLAPAKDLAKVADAPPAPAVPPVKESILPPSPTAVQAAPAEAVAAGAVQMLALLQRQGRLVDFLQEDLTPFEDAQIGAAVRPIHQGCKEALAQHARLESIYSDAEGSRVTVQPGFDAYAVRLSGNVAGDPPFSGTLQHRGWRIGSLELPAQTSEQAASKVVAAAEIEVGA